MEIGVAPGIHAALNTDSEPRCRGASVEQALVYAAMKLEEETGDRRDFLNEIREGLKQK
jgi:hypothetical protein